MIILKKVIFMYNKNKKKLSYYLKQYVVVWGELKFKLYRSFEF